MKITDEMVSAARVAYETLMPTNGTKRDEAMRRALTAAITHQPGIVGLDRKLLEETLGYVRSLGATTSHPLVVKLTAALDGDK